MGRRGACAAVIAMIALGAVAPAADARAAKRTVNVRSTFEDPGFLSGIRGFRCAIDHPGLCEIEARGHSVVDGTMTGESDYTFWGWMKPDGSGFGFRAYETFTGEVAGCGRGTFDFVLEDGTVDGDQSETDPAAHDLHATWRVVPGTGTGGLSGLLTGSGEENGIAYGDTSNEGAFTGTLVCRPSPGSRRGIA